VGVPMLACMPTWKQEISTYSCLTLDKEKTISNESFCIFVMGFGPQKVIREKRKFESNNEANNAGFGVELDAVFTRIMCITKR
jgi:hypothetical protein